MYVRAALFHPQLLLLRTSLMLSPAANTIKLGDLTLLCWLHSLLLFLKWAEVETSTTGFFPPQRLPRPSSPWANPGCAGFWAQSARETKCPASSRTIAALAGAAQLRASFWAWGAIVFRVHVSLRAAASCLTAWAIPLRVGSAVRSEGCFRTVSVTDTRQNKLAAKVSWCRKERNSSDGDGRRG